jgi:uncharacterized protein YceH (UPF0502 family)
MLAVMRIDAVETRILGGLVEKQLTTPAQYPLSLNSLTLACNQSSNRDPVVHYEEATVEGGVASLKDKGLVRFVLPSHGRSVVRYRHVLDEKLALDQRQMALIAVLLLRGPQTVGELRVRTERMAQFDGVSDVEDDLIGLTRGDDPFVARLGRRPGQKEERWTQLLCPETGADQAVETATAGVASTSPANHNVDDRSDRGDALRVGQSEAQELRSEIEALRDEVQSLRSEVDELRSAILGL